MRLYKYYRPDLNFEKSLRYDEIYFASNEQLNDPYDLMIQPHFGNNKKSWRRILKSGAPYDTWNLSKIVDIDNDNLLLELNSEFEGVVILDSSSMRSVLDDKKSSLAKIFGKYLLLEREDMYKDSDTACEISTLILKEKLIRGWDKRYYSCSFSKDPLAPQMWAHYGGGFRGCVLIYREVDNGSISLRQNIYADNFQKFLFEEVLYQDKEKMVDILDLDSREILIQSNLLNKSLFWSYEKEMRLLLKESFGSQRVAITPEMPKSTRSQIFHHAPNVIEGVIFGSSCTESYKEKITSMLAEKYSFLVPVNSSAFLTFNSKLTVSGKVEISSGAICTIIEVGSNQVMKQKLENEQLNTVLEELGISRCSES